jgi:hypothetical protein
MTVNKGNLTSKALITRKNKPKNCPTKARKSVQFGASRSTLASCFHLPPLHSAVMVYNSTPK